MTSLAWLFGLALDQQCERQGQSAGGGGPAAEAVPRVAGGAGARVPVPKHTRPGRPRKDAPDRLEWRNQATLAESEEAVTRQVYRRPGTPARAGNPAAGTLLRENLRTEHVRLQTVGYVRLICPRQIDAELRASMGVSARVPHSAHEPA
jgi:hypothetical protein